MTADLSSEPDIRLRRTVYALMVVSWIVVVTLVIIVWVAVERANDAATEVGVVTLRNDCQDRIVAELDTEWRTALDRVLHQYIEGEVGGAQASLARLEQAATVNIEERIDRACGPTR